VTAGTTTGAGAVAQRFDACRAEGRAALVGYLPVGYPSVPASVAAMLDLVEAGVDLVEVGFPYSDPLMDGPVIQAAVEQALSQGLRAADVLGAVEALAGHGVTAVVMTYWNPVERYGVEAFARDLAAAGGAGLITPDLIPDEAAPWLTAARAHDLASVFLVAPSSSEERLASTVQACRGFVYAASTMGITGTRAQLAATAPALVARTRRHTALPVAVGLGVSTAEQAAEVAGYADGVIVGTAFVRRLLDDEPVVWLARELAAGVRAGSAAPPGDLP
jgi:tryptophan synthase alpha chain